MSKRHITTSKIPSGHTFNRDIAKNIVADPKGVVGWVRLNPTFQKYVVFSCKIWGNYSQQHPRIIFHLWNHLLFKISGFESEIHMSVHV